MQHISYATEIAQQATYNNAIVKKEANKKIFMFMAILGCLVLAVNI